MGLGPGEGSGVAIGFAQTGGQGGDVGFEAGGIHAAAVEQAKHGIIGRHTVLAHQAAHARSAPVMEGGGEQPVGQSLAPRPPGWQGRLERDAHAKGPVFLGQRHHQGEHRGVEMVVVMGIHMVEGQPGGAV